MITFAKGKFSVLLFLNFLKINSIIIQYKILCAVIKS